MAAKDLAPTPEEGAALRHIDLGSIPIGVINLPQHPHRLSRISEALKHHGMTFRVIEGVSDNPRFRGCARAHLAAIRALRGSGPFLVLEDDALPTDALRTRFDVPREAGLLYLGHSPYGHAPGGLSGAGSSIASDHPSGYLHVRSMLAAHAIVYLDDAATDAVEASIAASIASDPPLRHDIGLTAIQRERLVLAVPDPCFVQDAELQGARKRDQRREESVYRIEPSREGDRRTIRSSQGTKNAILQRHDAGHPVWQVAADETDAATLYGTKLSTIYANVAALDRDPDPQGWNSNHPILKKAVEARRPERIIEVGVWKGMSVIAMALAARNCGLAPRIYAVDTWLGSPEHWLDDNLRESLMLRNGFPTLYETFLRNVHNAGVTDIIEPVPMPSETAAFVFESKGITAEVIHIDAGHEFTSVMRDLNQYVPLLAQDGILIGDDYVRSFPGVKRAFNRYCRNNGFRLAKVGRKCVCAREEVFDELVAPLLE